MQVAILIFVKLTALDAIGPYEVLSRLPDADLRFVAKEPGTKRTDTGALGITADAALAEVLVAALGCPRFRPYASNDVIGAEIGGERPRRRQDRAGRQPARADRVAQPGLDLRAHPPRLRAIDLDQQVGPVALEEFDRPFEDVALEAFGVDLDEAHVADIEVIQSVYRHVQFAMVAMDQRESVRAMYAGWMAGRISADVRVAFKVAVARVLSPHASALLLDVDEGLGRVLTAGALHASCGLIVAADDPAIHAAAEEFRRHGGQVDAVEVGLSTREGVDELYSAMSERPVDALLANAGHGLGQAFLDQDFDDIEHVIVREDEILGVIQ